jgi:Domain of unknown function (DUF4160)
MPTIAIFAGMVIQMFFEDHNPPHFHVRYQRYKALIRIADGAIIRGRLPAAKAAIVKAWALQRQAELMEDWRRAQSDGQLFRIAGPDD